MTAPAMVTQRDGDGIGGASAAADRAFAATPSSPSVSPVPASIPSADEFIRTALTAGIDRMLTELGNPPLVNQIYPNGWKSADRNGLINLYDLCRRTFEKRERANG